MQDQASGSVTFLAQRIETHSQINAVDKGLKIIQQGDHDDSQNRGLSKLHLEARSSN